MIRRSLRIGIRLGLLSGLAVAAFRIVQARRRSPALPEGDDGWAAAPSPSESGSLGARIDVATAVAPGPAEPFAMVAESPPGDDGFTAEPTADDAAGAELTPQDPGGEPGLVAPPVETAAEPFAPPVETVAEPVAEPVSAVTATPGTTAAGPAKAVAKAKGPSPAAEAAARAAAESAAKEAVAKAVAAKGAARAVAAKGATAAGWVRPQDGACPPSHPVKARLASRIFHLPGMAAYQRTAADRCYRDEASAEADGLRKAKR